MVVPDNSQPGQHTLTLPHLIEVSNRDGKTSPAEDSDSTIEEQLAIAKAHRTRAETARQKVVNELMEAARELYQKLVNEGEQTLEKAKQLDAESRLKHLEAQRELERAQSIIAGADAYQEEVIVQAQLQAQAIKAEAIAFREKVLAEVQQAQEMLRQAHLDAEQAGVAAKQKRSIEVEKRTAQAEPAKDASSLAGTSSKKRLSKNELVVGLELEGHAKAYPVQMAADCKVINDTVAGEDVVVAFGPPSEPGIIFRRCVEGRSLTFAPLPETANGLMLMEDQETGTTWEALTGRAISGTLASKELQRLTSEYSFWFAWRELHPDTEVYAGQ